MRLKCPASAEFAASPLKFLFYLSKKAVQKTKPCSSRTGFLISILSRNFATKLSNFACEINIFNSNFYVFK